MDKIPNLPSFGFQSTRPMRGATGYATYKLWEYNVSIHAPHAGRDLLDSGAIPFPILVSIHAPHAGRDQ